MAPEFIIGDFKQIRIFQNMFRQDSELTEDIRQRVMRAGQLDGQLVSVNAQAGKIISGAFTPCIRAFDLCERAGIDTIGGSCFSGLL